MKKLALALAALTVSTPAIAQDFAGPRVGAEIGFTDDDFLGTEEFSWGINAGYDWDLGNLVVGGTVAYNDFFDDDADFREFSFGGRLGTKLDPATLVYVSGAYSDLDIGGADLDGLKIGLGAEFAVTRNVYVNLETRYGNYDYGLDLYQTVFGAGYRF